jgi:hypothetical protein
VKLAQESSELEYGEQTQRTHVLAVRDGKRFLINQTLEESALSHPLTHEKRTLGQSKTEVKIQDATLALHYCDALPVDQLPAKISLPNEARLSLQAADFDHIFDNFTFYDVFNIITNSNKLQVYSKKISDGLKIIRDTTTEIVVGNSKREYVFDKEHGMLIREQFFYESTPNGMVYISGHSVNSDFRFVSGYWYPFKSICENSKWDTKTSAARIVHQSIIDVKQVEINCNITATDLDFVIPSRTQIIAADQTPQIAMLPLPYMVKTPIAFSNLKMEIGPAGELAEKLLTQDLDKLRSPQPMSLESKISIDATTKSASPKSAKTMVYKNDDKAGGNTKIYWKLIAGVFLLLAIVFTLRGFKF